MGPPHCQLPTRQCQLHSLCQEYFRSYMQECCHFIIICLLYQLWDSETLSQLGVFRGHSRGLQCVQFSPMENILGTSSMDKSIKLWELKNFKCVKVNNQSIN